MAESWISRKKKEIQLQLWDRKLSYHCIALLSLKFPLQSLGAIPLNFKLVSIAHASLLLIHIHLNSSFKESAVFFSEADVAWTKEHGALE